MRLAATICITAFIYIIRQERSQFAPIARFHIRVWNMRVMDLPSLPIPSLANKHFHEPFQQSKYYEACTIEE